jgi:hypothetical protein
MKNGLFDFGINYSKIQITMGSRRVIVHKKIFSKSKFIYFGLNLFKIGGLNPKK